MKANMYLDDEEVVLVLTHRAEQMTGYRVHKEYHHTDTCTCPNRATRYYIWPWGRQPDEPLYGFNPVDAAMNFLKVYEPNKEPFLRDNDPVRRKPKECPTCHRPLPHDR